MKTYKKIVSASIIVLYLASCSPKYIPNVVNAPIFEQEGDFQASINLGTSIFDAQLSYAVTNNIGVMVNGSFGNSNQTDSTTTGNTMIVTKNVTIHDFMEGGVGYYDSVGKNVGMEIYGGFGIGNSTTKTNEIVTTDLNSMRFFIQPAVGYRGKIVDGIFATRFVMVYITENIITKNGMFIEPVFIGRLGWKRLKISSQLGISVPVGNNSSAVKGLPILFSFGLHYNISEIHKKF